MLALRLGRQVRVQVCRQCSQQAGTIWAETPVTEQDKHFITGEKSRRNNYFWQGHGETALQVPIADNLLLVSRVWSDPPCRGRGEPGHGGAAGLGGRHSQEPRQVQQSLPRAWMLHCPVHPAYPVQAPTNTQVLKGSMYICRFIFTATGQVPSAMAGVAAHLTTAPSRPVLLHCLSDTGVMVQTALYSAVDYIGVKSFQGLSLAVSALGGNLQPAGIVWDR